VFLLGRNAPRQDVPQDVGAELDSVMIFPVPGAFLSCDDSVSFALDLMAA